MGIYKYIREAWKKPKTLESQPERLRQYRKQGATVRVEYPTRLDRARSLGYKAKQGVFVVRQRIGKGGHSRPSITGGRRTAHSSQTMTLGKSHQSLAEERAARKYPNAEVLNSYFVGRDGMHAWYEVIFVDPTKVVTDKDLRWIVAPQHTRRVFRGLTSAGKKSRGLRNKGKGAEKVRPSGKANKRRVK